MDELFEEHGDNVAFFMVYIREAHPTDGWQSGGNVREGVLVKQPTTLEQRAEVCSTMCDKLELKLPPLVDSIDDRVNKAYAALPDRMYLVNKEGRIAYKGQPGPWGFRPEELAAAIERELGRAGAESQAENAADP